MAKLRTFPSSLLALAASLTILALSGCGGDELELAPARGVVTLDGEPLAEAEVLFAPASGVPAVATTDGEGRFTLNTRQEAGATVGEYRVAIVKLDTSKLPKLAPGQMITDLPEIQDIDLPSLVPLRYTSPDTSGLTATVTSGGPEFKFELTSQP